jgi:hypothetical protein
MSSSSRNASPGITWALMGPMLLCGLALPPANAADTYVEPTFTVGGEYDTNRRMVTTSGGSKSLNGYYGTADALIGIRTPRSLSELRPYVRYQAFPSARELDRTEGGIDFKTRFNTIRSETNFLGTFYRRDDYNSQFVNVGFDPFNPNAPSNSDGVATNAVETRTQLDLHPNFVYRWSETMGVGVDLEYQNVKFTSDTTVVQEDYDNWDAELYLERRVSPKTRVVGGATAGRFKTKDGSNVTDSVGASFGVFHDWSTQTQGAFQLTAERSKVDQGLLNVKEEKSTDVGAELSAFHRGEVSRIRFVLGRSLVPTGAGERTTRDEVRAQYDRDLSQRLSFRGALRAFRQRPLSSNAVVDKANRDVATGEISLEWRYSPTWFVTGGYSYTWQDIATNNGPANNNRVYLSVGYRALGYRRNR